MQLREKKLHLPRSCHCGTNIYSDCTNGAAYMSTYFLLSIYLFIYLFICLLCKCVCSVYVICNKIYTIQVTSSRLAWLHSKQEKFILTKKVQSSENTNQACVIRSIFQQHTSQHTQQEKKSVRMQCLFNPVHSCSAEMIG